MRLLLILIGMLIAGPLCAQDREPVRLSPNEAVEMALKNNLSLESARVSTGTKKRASDLSWNQFIPSITAGASLIKDTGKTSGTQPVDLANALNPIYTALGIPGGFPSNTLYGVYPYSMDTPLTIAGTVQASLTISMAMFENMKRLRLDYEGGLVSYEKAKTQLERDVRKAYNNMVLLQENINLINESYAGAGRRVDMARANYNAGLVPELTLLQAQVAVENMKPTIDQIENGMRLSKAQFAMFLGLPYDTPFELLPVESAHNYIPLDVRELISKAASGKPDIQELRQTILMLQSARKAQFYALMPALTLSWSPTPLLYLGDPVSDWTKPTLGSFTITLGLRLHSLFPLSADYQGIKNMDDQIRTANIGLAQMIQGTEIEIYNTILSLEKTQTTAEVQTQTVNLAERAYRLTEEAYRAGLQDLLQVQNAELELKQARVSMLEQQFNYLNGLLDLEYSIGVPFGTLTKEN